MGKRIFAGYNGWR